MENLELIIKEFEKKYVVKIGKLPFNSVIIPNNYLKIETYDNLLLAVFRIQNLTINKVRLILEWVKDINLPSSYVLDVGLNDVTTLVNNFNLFFKYNPMYFNSFLFGSTVNPKETIRRGKYIRKFFIFNIKKELNNLGYQVYSTHYKKTDVYQLNIKINTIKTTLYFVDHIFYVEGGAKVKIKNLDFRDNKLDNYKNAAKYIISKLKESRL